MKSAQKNHFEALKVILIMSIIMLFSSITFVQQGNTQMFSYYSSGLFNPFYYSGYFPAIPVLVPPVYSYPARNALALLPTPGGGTLTTLLAPTITSLFAPAVAAPTVTISLPITVLTALAAPAPAPTLGLTALLAAMGGLSPTTLTTFLALGII